MPATTMQGGTGTYLQIIKGQLKQKVEEGTPGAEKREYELKDGTKGEKWEIPYDGWMGKIKELRIKEKDFGDVLDVVFDDAILSISMDSRYFADFVKKFASANPNEEISINPYDFTGDDGKRKTGLSMVQNNEKLKDYFESFKDGKFLYGFPKPEGDERTSDDWKIYFLKVKKFLKKWLEENPITKTEKEEEVNIDDPQITGNGELEPPF